jgi:hypothetical protein
MIPTHLVQMMPALHPTPLVYGDPTFNAVTDLAHRVVQVGRVRGLLGAMVRHPAMVLAALLAVWRLPIVHITVNSRQAATWFSPDYPPSANPIFGGCRAQAVLDLGPDDTAYMVGRRKQALRTNLRHARQMGLQAKRVATYDEWSGLAHEVLLSRGGQRELELVSRMQPPPDMHDVGYYIITDQEDRPVAYSLAAIFNNCAVLTCMLSTPNHPAASPARYSLHTFMRSDLRSLGVHHLVVGSAITVSPGLQYFQHLLGYEVRNLHITVQDAAESVLAPSFATV